MDNTTFTVLCAMQHLGRPAKLADIAALCVVVNPPSIYTMPLETARRAVQELTKRGFVVRPKPTLYGLQDPRAVRHPVLMWTLDEPRALVARGGFVIEGTGADRRVSRIAPGLPTRALSLSEDGAQVFSDLSYDMWAARREGGEAGYRAALDAVQRTAAFHRLAVELDDAPQFVCGHCGETVRPHRKHCAGAREGSRAEDMPPCKLVLRIAVDLERAPTESGTASTRDSHVPALDAVFDAFGIVERAIKDAHFRSTRK